MKIPVNISISEVWKLNMIIDKLNEIKGHGVLSNGQIDEFCQILKGIENSIITAAVTPRPVEDVHLPEHSQIERD